MFMEAIIETGGKQYKVKEGEVIRVEKLSAEKGGQATFDKVLAVLSPDKNVFGTPLVSGATVTATVVTQGRGRKIVVFKYKSKKNYRRRTGHRQSYTQVKIEKINVA